MAFENSWHEAATATGGEGSGAGSGGSDGPTLTARIWITLGFLIVYRLGTFVPIPGVDLWVLDDLFWYQVHAFGVFGIFDMFSGGALGRMSIFALSVMPYLLAVVLMQLLATVSPRLKALGRQGADGRRKMRQYICYATVLLCAIQSYGLSVGLESMTGWSAVVYDPGLVFRLTTVVTLTAGTMLLVWLAEQITRRGIGNGIALIISSGIVANLPKALATMLEFGRTGALSDISIILALVMALALTALIVFVERARREMIVVYSRRQSGTRLFGGSTSCLTLKPNPSGVAAPVLASALLAVPLTATFFPGGIARGEWLGELTDRIATSQPVYLAVYAGLIVIFAVLCSRTLFDPTDIANSLKRYAGAVPGIRPGEDTAEHLDHIQTCLSAAGVAYMLLVCLLPDILIALYGFPFHLGGTSLFVIVVVARDILRRIGDEPSASSS